VRLSRSLSASRVALEYEGVVCLVNKETGQIPSTVVSKPGYVYILASERNGTLYVGVTNDLVRRVKEHRQERDPDSFTAQYDVTNPSNGR